TIQSAAFWTNPDIVYRMAGDVTVAEGITLTVGAGQVVKSFGSVDLFVNGRLIADGTAADRIIFTSDRDDTAGGDTNNDGAAATAGIDDWGSIQFGPTSNNSLMDFVDVRY